MLSLLNTNNIQEMSADIKVVIYSKRRWIIVRRSYLIVTIAYHRGKFFMIGVNQTIFFNKKYWVTYA